MEDELLAGARGVFQDEDDIAPSPTASADASSAVSLTPTNPFSTPLATVVIDPPEAPASAARTASLERSLPPPIGYRRLSHDQLAGLEAAAALTSHRKPRASPEMEMLLEVVDRPEDSAGSM